MRLASLHWCGGGHCAPHWCTRTRDARPHAAALTMAASPTAHSLRPYPMIDLLAALLLGIIEGITEFLPISSTGHLLIAERWLGHRSDLFNVAIQAGAILAVVLIYRHRLWQLATQFFTEHESRDYAAKLAMAFGITAVLGLVMKKFGFQLPSTVTPIAWALMIGAVWMVAAEYFAGLRAA